MPLAPNLIERTVFLTLNQAPGPILDLWSGAAFHTVLAAIRLNLFETLHERPQSAEGVAQQLQINPQGARLLLEALEALGYVTRRGDAYANSAMTSKWFINTGVLNMSAFYQYWGVLIEHFLPKLTESIRSGAPPVNLYEWIEDQPEASRYFQEGMIAITRFVEKDVLRKITLPTTAKRLLDLGGGHGAYSIALCQKYPQLTAVIFDGAQALTTGQAAIAGAGLTARITPQIGNFVTDPLASGYDVVLFFNIIHGFTPEQNIALLCKIKDTLNPGGQVIVLDQIPGVSPLPLQETIVRLLSLSFYHLLGGRVYSAAEIKGWLQDAGFAQVQRRNIPKAGSALLIGRKG